ncbi:biotin transporter BioY [Clostridium chrysemydis]|uniref:biotin transporter BioY n=1 Tax=Clostridium chrysemydis TaxID=2665504 RepID=UPI001883499F|nr:biotin transporter BioY [Clostridium chrysemydis]
MKLKTRDLILISIFAALTAIGAFIRIPIPIVPFTLQYFFCSLGAILLGSKRGALAQILYVFIGLIGIPVFTQGGGPSYVFQPTFGYLIGFIFGAFIIGKIIENVKSVNPKTIFLAGILGLLVIYIFGVSYMYLIYNIYLGQAMSPIAAVSIGAIACMPSDLVSTIIISLVGSKIYSRLKVLNIA